MIRAAIVLTAAISILIAGASHAKADNNPFSGATSIKITMTRDAKGPPIGGQAETCIASEYGVGDGYHGKRAADGSIFNTYASAPYTVAHRTRRLGTWVTVTSLATGRSIRAKVTDRGPYYHARCVDLGRAGALAIGMSGLAKVTVQ